MWIVDRLCKINIENWNKVDLKCILTKKNGLFEGLHFQKVLVAEFHLLSFTSANWRKCDFFGHFNHLYKHDQYDHRDHHYQDPPHPYHHPNHHHNHHHSEFALNRAILCISAPPAA